ncbi:MAG: DUF6364 family protein [bacterium]
MATKPIPVDEKQNFTLRVSKAFVRYAKILAAERGISVSKLVEDTVMPSKLDSESYQQAYREWQEDMKNVHHGGGSTAKSRDELHERR